MIDAYHNVQSTLSDVEKKQVLLYRIFGLGCVPGVAYTYWVATQDFAGERWILDGGFFSYLLFSAVLNLFGFINLWVTRRLALFGLVGGLCLTVFVGYKMQVNSMDFRDVTESLLLVAFVVFMFNHLRYLIAWCAGSFAILGICALGALEPVYPVTSYLVSLAATAVIVGCVKVNLIKTSSHVMRSNGLLNAVFEQSSDGLLYGKLADLRVAGANARMLELFETDDPNLIAKLINSAWRQAHAGEKDLWPKVQVGIIEFNHGQRSRCQMKFHIQIPVHVIMGVPQKLM